MDAHVQRGHITRSKQFGCLAIPGKRRRSDCPRFLFKYDNESNSIIMKKYLLISFFFFNLCTSAQKSYWEMHDPSPDSIMSNVKVSTLGGIYTLSSVDSIPNKTKEQLYSTAKEWIGRVYKDPKTVIKSENPPTQIVFEGQLTSSQENDVTTSAFHGRVELNFKDGRYKWTISDISSHMTVMGRTTTSPIERIPRYSLSRGERGAKWLLADLYDFFQYFKTLMQGESEDDW